MSDQFDPSKVTRAAVIIVTWNNEDTIRDCIASVLSQTDIELDVVIVDNNSSDETCQQILSMEIETVQLVRSPHNLGFARGANLGASRTSSPFLVFLNPDTTLPEPSVLIRCIRALEEDPTVGTVGVRTLLEGGGVQPTAFPRPTLAVELIEGFGLYKLLPQARRAALLMGAHWDHSYDRHVGWLLGAFLVVPRGVWAALGGFTEDFHMYSEDLDWGVKVGAAGWKNLFLASEWIEHKSGHSGQIRWGSARSLVGFRSYYRWLQTRHGRPRRVLSAWVNLAGFTLRLIAYSVRAHRGRGEDLAWRDEYRRLTAFHARLILNANRTLWHPTHD